MPNQQNAPLTERPFLYNWANEGYYKSATAMTSWFMPFETHACDAKGDPI